MTLIEQAEAMAERPTWMDNMVKALAVEARMIADDRDNYANALESGIQTDSAADDVLRDCVAIMRCDAALIRRMSDELRKAGEYVEIEQLGRG